MLLGWWFLRRRHKFDEFDGDFDPDRVVRPGHGGDVDLIGGNGGVEGAEVTPFTLGPDGEQRQQNLAPGGQQMSQRPNVPPFLSGGLGPTSPTSYTTTAPSASAYSHSQSYYAPSEPSASSQYPEHAAYAGFTDASDPNHRGGAISPTHTNTTTTNTNTTSGLLPSAKEREAAAYRARYVANNVGEDGAGGSGYVQHQDGGRVEAGPREEEPEVPSEVPPSYDSIPRDGPGSERR